MDAAQTAELVVGQGLASNANQGGKRQITLIEMEVWSRLMRELGADLPTATRRANLVVSQLPLALTRGRILRIGDCQLRINGETKPCERMDEACMGIKAALYPDWGGGAFAEVVTGGRIAVGDKIKWA
jgi:MOSC domain-containing protein YiiM